MKNARHSCDKCIYNWLRLLDVVMRLEYNTSKSANVIETKFN